MSTLFAWFLCLFFASALLLIASFHLYKSNRKAKEISFIPQEDDREKEGIIRTLIILFFFFFKGDSSKGLRLYRFVGGCAGISSNYTNKVRDILTQLVEEKIATCQSLQVGTGGNHENFYNLRDGVKISLSTTLLLNPSKKQRNKSEKKHLLILS